MIQYLRQSLLGYVFKQLSVIQRPAFYITQIQQQNQHIFTSFGKPFTNQVILLVPRLQQLMLPMRSPPKIEQPHNMMNNPSVSNQVQSNQDSQNQSIFEKIRNYGNKSPRPKSPIPHNKIMDTQIHQQNYINNQSDVKMYQTQTKEIKKKHSLIRVGSNPNINKQNISYAILKGRDQSPNKLNSTRKPMISPVRASSGRTPIKNPGQKVGLLQSPAQKVIMPIKTTNYNTAGRTLNGNIFNQNKNPVINNRVHNIAPKCINHSQKTAQYLVSNDEEQFQYCNKCATQLASQGFTVIPTNQAASCRKVGSMSRNRGFQSNSKRNVIQFSRSSGIRSSKTPSKIYRPHRELPYRSDLKNQQKYHQIMHFLQELYTVEDFHFDSLEQLTQHFQNDFRRQIQMTGVFYQKLVKIVQRMRDDHLADLEVDFRKKYQQNLIEADSIKGQLSDLDEIRMDIQMNLQSIVLNVQAQQFQICVQQYRDKVGLFKFQCQQISQRVRKNYPDDLTQLQIENKLQQAIQGLKNLWAEQYGQNDQRGLQKDRRVRNQQPNNRSNSKKVGIFPNVHFRSKSDINISHNSQYHINDNRLFDQNQRVSYRKNIEQNQNYHIASQESETQSSHSPQIRLSPPKICNPINFSEQQFQFHTNAQFDYRKSGNYQNHDPHVDPFLKKNLNSHRNQNNFDVNEHFNQPNIGIQKKPFRSLFDEEAVSPQFKKI